MSLSMFHVLQPNTNLSVNTVLFLILVFLLKFHSAHTHTYLEINTRHPCYYTNVMYLTHAKSSYFKRFAGLKLHLLVCNPAIPNAQPSARYNPPFPSAVHPVRMCGEDINDKGICKLREDRGWLATTNNQRNIRSKQTLKENRRILTAEEVKIQYYGNCQDYAGYFKNFQKQQQSALVLNKNVWLMHAIVSLR